MIIGTAMRGEEEEVEGGGVEVEGVVVVAGLDFRGVSGEVRDSRGVSGVLLSRMPDPSGTISTHFSCSIPRLPRLSPDDQPFS